MTKEEAKQKIVEIITEKQGCKATELPVMLSYDKALLEHPIPELADELVKEGELVEVEYVLPNMNWRVKSFYLPKGTTVRFGLVV